MDYTEALEKIRQILIKTDLEETVKWGHPTFTYQGKNILGLGIFKSYVGLWFFNGAFLSDPHQILINAQEGKTKGMRQMRFETMEAIQEDIILSYIKESIQNQKEGKKITPEKKPLVLPDELTEALNADPALAEAFDKFTTGRKKEFAEYIQEAKRAETRLARLEKILPMIKDGIGLNDKYR